MIAYLTQLFVSLLDLPVTAKTGERPVRNSDRQAVELFLKGLRENSSKCEEIKSLKQISERCGMGVTYFAGYTRELVNIVTIAILKQCRLNHAPKQLHVQLSV